MEAIRFCDMNLAGREVIAERQRKEMGIVAHTMEYRGDILFSDMKLRNYSDIDYLEYKKIYEDCFFEMRTALGLLPVNCCGKRENLQKKRNKIFILEESGRLIGSIAIYGNEIDDLIVAKEVQGQGYGQSLLKFAICHMQNNGVSPICLHVADWNQKAVRMYLKSGFFITKTEIV